VIGSEHQQYPLERTDEAASIARQPLTVTVLICAYTLKRWGDLDDAVAGVFRQTQPAHELVIIIDHNPELLERAQPAFPGARVIPNAHARGLSGARNTGVAIASGEIVAFLDDDAIPADTWLEELVAPFADAAVVGVGGAALPRWPEHRPVWFPPEFDWVVGCSYQGLPTKQTQIRNPIGATMAFRRRAFEVAGGFTEGVGRVGTLPLGCEETEFAIRATAQLPGSTVMYVPNSVVHHRVSEDRVAWRYFLRRCYSEGISKAAVARLVGRESALASEQTYVRRTLPAGIRRDLRRPEPGASRRRALATTAGLAAAATGYARARLRQS
jgi:GT2 family glycosyltransferase